MRLNPFATFLLLAAYLLLAWEGITYINGSLSIWSYDWAWGWKFVIVLIVFYVISEVVIFHTFLEDVSIDTNCFTAIFAVGFAPIALPLYLISKILTWSQVEFKPSSFKDFDEVDEDDY